MDMCDKEVNSYDELLEKRKEVNEILKYIKNQDLLHLIIDTVNKQFNTITMEEQDINTFKDLTIEKERKQEAIKEIEEENNSMRFQSVLKELIENERKHQEKIMEEQRRIEEIERQKRLEINNTDVAITITDTAGAERFRSINKMFYKGADGILIGFDLTEKTLIYLASIVTPCCNAHCLYAAATN